MLGSGLCTCSSVQMEENDGQKINERRYTRPLSNDLTKSSPLHSDCLSPASAGEEKQPVVIMLIHCPHFPLLFSVTTVREGFCTARETFTPQRHTPPETLQHKHLRHCCVWSTILVSTQPSIIILDLYCSSKIAHSPAPWSQGAERCSTNLVLLRTCSWSRCPLQLSMPGARKGKLQKEKRFKMK